jgi:hypothetical protein
VDLVTDGHGDRPALADRVRRLAEARPGAVVEVHLVAPCDTLAAGFCVAEHALAGGSGWHLVAHDVAPRDADPGPWPEGAGLLLCVGRSAAGALVLGPNAGWSWSFAAAGLASGLCCVDVPVGATDPPGVDRLVTAIAHVRAGHPHAVAGTLPRTAVPPVPEQAVAHVDAAGNVKTTIMRLPVAPGARVTVRIGEIRAPAVTTDGSRPAPDGQLELLPTPLGLELRVGGGSASERFGMPSTGTPIGLGPVEVDAPATAGP